MATTKTTRKRAKGRPKDPTGRVDLLLSRLISQAVSNYAPQLKELHAELAPRLELELVRRLGPRTKRGRQVRNFIKLAQAQRPAIGAQGPTHATGGGQA